MHACLCLLVFSVRARPSDCFFSLWPLSRSGYLPCCCQWKFTPNDVFRDEIATAESLKLCTSLFLIHVANARDKTATEIELHVKAPTKHSAIE